MNKKIFFSVIFIFLFFSAGAFLFKDLTSKKTAFTSVEKRNMSSEIFASGKVESSSDVSLFFKNSAKVNTLLVQVGDLVKTGAVLATQDTKDLDALDVELDAAIVLQKARINQFKAGSSDEEISKVKVTLTNASTSYSSATISFENTKKEALASLENAYTNVDDAIYNKVDQLFIGPTQQSPNISFAVVSDFSLGNEVGFQRKEVESTLISWRLHRKASNTSSDIVKDIIVAKQTVIKVKELINKLAVIVNNPTNKPTQISDDAWSIIRENIASARLNLDAVTSRLILSESNLSKAESVVIASQGQIDSAKSEVILKKAKVRSTDLAVYYAQLQQAIAAKEQNISLRKDIQMTAPFSGTVTSVDIKNGEIATPQKKVLTLLAEDELTIKLNVIETNIVKVKVGQNTRITFDALPEKELAGLVTFIDPAETIIGGSVYYKVTVIITEKQSFIRSGMTANVWIEVAKKEQVLSLPFSALLKEGEIFFVYVKTPSLFKKEKRIVQVGNEDRNGFFEILSGVKEGEVVLLES